VRSATVDGSAPANAVEAGLHGNRNTEAAAAVTGGVPSGGAVDQKEARASIPRRARSHPGRRLRGVGGQAVCKPGVRQGNSLDAAGPMRP